MIVRRARICPRGGPERRSPFIHSKSPDSSTGGTSKQANSNVGTRRSTPGGTPYAVSTGCARTAPESEARMHSARASRGASMRTKVNQPRPG